MREKSFRYLAIVVIYNKNINDSIACMSLKEVKNIAVAIVDNSTRDYKNENICNELSYFYVNMHGNKGLSKAYNKAISSFEADVYILLDDDTPVPQNYFEELDCAVNENPDYDIFVPKIHRKDGKLISPNEYHFLKCRMMKDTACVPSSQRFNAISSCMAIKKSVFFNYKYNEELFMDQVDYNFCIDQRNRKKSFYIINVDIIQNFYQFEDKISAKQGWRRTSIRIRDILQHGKILKEKRYVFLAIIKSLFIAFEISIKCKSISIFFNSILLIINIKSNLHNKFNGGKFNL